MILIPVFLLALYLFAIMPRMVGRPDVTALLCRHYAHRGLHDNRTQAPENSMAAFQKAVEAGYGIELDVQLTKDRIPVVFHDETLDRVCGISGKVRDFTFAQLQQFPLYHSGERIPLFSDFLKLVDGKIPLIVEIKVHEKASDVCEKVDELLQNYSGVYCVESFHPYAMKWYRTHRPEVIRGQLSTNFNKPEKKEYPAQKAVRFLLTNFLCRPDFIAYDHRFRNNASRRICRFFRPLNVAWTIKTQEELDACRDDFDLFIFEGFIPQ